MVVQAKSKSAGHPCRSDQPTTHYCSDQFWGVSCIDNGDLYNFAIRAENLRDPPVPREHPIALSNALGWAWVGIRRSRMLDLFDLVAFRYEALKLRSNRGTERT